MKTIRWTTLETRINTGTLELQALVSSGKMQLLDSDEDWELVRDDIVNMQKRGKLGDSYPGNITHVDSLLLHLFLNLVKYLALFR